MADANGSLAGQTANLHLDEVTGERVSKSELKKRVKQRENEARKQQKAAAAPPQAQRKTSAEDSESNLNPNVCSSPVYRIPLTNASNISRSEA